MNFATRESHREIQPFSFVSTPTLTHSNSAANHANANNLTQVLTALRDEDPAFNKVIIEDGGNSFGIGFSYKMGQ